MNATEKTYTVDCPICGEEECSHFLGWTEDGRTIGDPVQGRSALVDPEPIQPSDRIVNTGVSARVYRTMTTTSKYAGIEVYWSTGTDPFEAEQIRGVLTCEHPQSCYGLPVLVTEDGEVLSPSQVPELGWDNCPPEMWRSLAAGALQAGYRLRGSEHFRL